MSDTDKKHFNTRQKMLNLHNDTVVPSVIVGVKHCDLKDHLTWLFQCILSSPPHICYTAAFEKTAYTPFGMHHSAGWMKCMGQVT